MSYLIPTVNFHTHTHFCDGRHAPEDIVKTAIEKGFSALGFSGHAYTSFDNSCCMSVEGTKRYKEEINRLKHLYRDRIALYCGIEMDYYSEDDTDGYDFVIGSVHYTHKNGRFYSFDGGGRHFAETLAAFDNDAYALAENYYSLLEDIVRKLHPDIIGHFDLVTKFNEGNRFFSEEHPRYRAAAGHAAAVLAQENCLFEINTGGMARGYRSVPYPSFDIVEQLANSGARFILASDCHDKNMLDYGFRDVLDSRLGPLIHGRLAQPFA